MCFAVVIPTLRRRHASHSDQRVGLGFGVFGGGRNDDGGGDLVVGVEVEELDAEVERPAERAVLVSMRMILPTG